MNATAHVSLHQLARVTRLPRAWLRREADAGRLPCLRVGRRRLFRLDEVERVLAERSRTKGVRDGR